MFSALMRQLKRQFLGDARLQGLKAIQSGRVITTQNYFRLDQSHCVLGVQWLATQLYPEIFGDRAAPTKQSS